MELKELEEKSKKMLASFIDEIELDGEEYVSTACNCPIIYCPLHNLRGEYISPHSPELKAFLRTQKYNEKNQKIFDEQGVILINQDYEQKQANKDLYVTVIHEMLHSCRNLLIFDALRNKKNETAFTYNNGHFEQNIASYGFSYADASQDILKGSIDTSRKAIQNYKGKTSDEVNDIDWEEGVKDAQMEKQRIVDEALVELMAILSYTVYNDKLNEEKIDIWQKIELAKKNNNGEDIKIMCEIILKHHDLELFNWMLDPITYSGGDIHYNFFEEYTKNDQDLLERLYDSDIYDDDALEIFGIDKIIGMEDMEKMAKSTTAIQELSHSIQDIKNAQDLDKKTEERE